MKMYGIATDLGDDWAGPYMDQGLLQKTLAIIQMVDPNAEIVSKETDPFSEQIQAGLLPYWIHVDLLDGMPQLPADVLDHLAAQLRGRHPGWESGVSRVLCLGREREGSFA